MGTAGRACFPLRRPFVCGFYMFVIICLFVFFSVDSLKPRNPRILHVIEISVSSYINLDINIEGEEGNVIATRLRS